MLRGPAVVSHGSVTGVCPVCERITHAILPPALLRCTVASLLTLALHTDLPYLTEVMQDLLRALMDQSSNVQPKLLLRRTESIVEKLLTNWMSICLYGFLRVS